MFINHKIINKENEQILLLYIDNNYEFSKDFFSKKTNNYSLLKQIKKYIKKHKINFNGNKVYLLLSGIVISSILLTSSFTLNYKEIPHKYVSGLDNLIVEKNVNNLHFNEDNQPKGDVVTDENLSNKPVDNTTDNKIEENVSSPIINEPIKNISPPIKQNEPDPITEPAPQPPAPPKQSEPAPQPVPSEQMITLYKSNGSVVSILLEEYVVGVVGAEMPASFNIEALKAQSVVARTYALKRIKEGKQITDTKIQQVYYNNNKLESIWGSSYDYYFNKIKQAVSSTKDEYVSYNNYYIDALYHSTSNGKTEDPINVWGGSFPYLKVVDSSWDVNASSYLRTTSFKLEELEKIFGFKFNNTTTIEITSKTSGDRVNNIKIGENNYRGIEIRDLLNLRSADFDIEIINDEIIITTRGYGHGVGMSQYGANGMANSGFDYKKILGHYYPNTVIKK